jgi:peptide/nickel transport system substrate-binding protein
MRDAKGRGVTIGGSEAADTTGVAASSWELSRGGFLKLGAGLTAGGVLAACSSSASPSASKEGVKPKRGGHVSVAMITGGQTESVNPGAPLYFIDQARIMTTFDQLITTNPNGTGDIPMLAVETTPNSNFTVWRIKLRQGVTFHNGKTMTADDVLYSISTWKNPANYAHSLIGINIDYGGLRKIDTYTVELPFHRPYPSLAPYLSQQECSILQVGEKNFLKPIGTGPFELVSITPGQRSLQKRNPNYWMSGVPYLDELSFVSFADATSQLNALLGGEVNVMAGLSYQQAKAQQSSQQIKLLITHQPGPIPITMRVDRPPFNDVRVRQAMRLIADRPALIAGALNGFGTLGNDLPGRGLPYYDNSLPQRHQDIAQAKFLLKKAGQSNLTVTLQTSDIFPGIIESATLFAQQAKAAGINVKLQQEPTAAYFNPSQLYLKMLFAQDVITPMANLMTIYQENLTPTGGYNETHWGNPSWNALVNTAVSSTGSAATEKWAVVQRIFYDTGSWIVWAQPDFVDAYAPSVHGLATNFSGNLGNYNFTRVWLD